MNELFYSEFGSVSLFAHGAFVFVVLILCYAYFGFGWAVNGVLLSILIMALCH